MFFYQTLFLLINWEAWQDLRVVANQLSPRYADLHAIRRPLYIRVRRLLGLRLGGLGTEEEETSPTTLV